jgi:uncharacterized protein (DUF697 family)
MAAGSAVAAGLSDTSTWALSTGAAIKTINEKTMGYSVLFMGYFFMSLLENKYIV